MTIELEPVVGGAARGTTRGGAGTEPALAELEPGGYKQSAWGQEMTGGKCQLGSNMTISVLIKRRERRKDFSVLAALLG